MRPIYGFFVKPSGKRYNNTVNVEGKDLIVNTEITERDYEFVNREAEVLAVPKKYEGPIKPGDTLLVHHNVFRRWFDIRGNERNSGNFIDEDLYWVTDEQIFAYHNGKWNNCEGYTFVYPIENDDMWTTDLEKPLYGKTLDGTIVGFSPDSEYEFEMEGRKVYRILSHQITWTSNNNEKELSVPQSSL